MKCNGRIWSRALFMGSTLAVFLLPALGEATTAIVQTAGSQANALEGGGLSSDQTLANAAFLHVVVTSPLDGSPVVNLGGNVGDGSSPIALPAGWTLDAFPAFGGCGGMTPIRFLNSGNGAYQIAVVPVVVLGFCGGWISGVDYVYRIHINAGGFQGSGLGVLSVRP